MKRLIIFTLLSCIFLLSHIPISAEEPILVIDPHGHSSKINEIMFTPDGKTLISVAEDKTIRLWDVETGELLNTLRHQIGAGRDGISIAGALAPDGKILAVGGIFEKDETGPPVFLFHVESGEVAGVLKGHSDTVNSLDFSQDDKWLASGSNTEINIWDITTLPSQPVLVLKSSSIVFDLKFSPDARMLVSGHVDGSIRIWELPEDLQGFQNLAGLKPQHIIKKHSNVVSCIDWSADGKYIVSGDFDGNNFLWDSKKGKMKKKFKPMDTAAAMAFSPDSRHVVVSNGNKAEVYTVPKLKKISTFRKHVSLVKNTAFSNNVTASAFYDNELIATAGGNDYEIYIWNVKTGAVKTHIAGQGKRVQAVAFKNNLRLAFGNTSGGITKERAHKVSPLERFFDFADLRLHQKLLPGLKFSRSQTRSEGKRLQSKPGNKNPENWYILKVKGGGTIKNGPKDGWVRSYSFTPHGDVIVGSSHVLRLHRSDGSVLREFRGHTGEVWDVSISRNGKILASASDDQTIKLWNIETGECLATLFVARDDEWVCWTPEGYYAASAGGEKYIGWQINQGMDKAALYYPAAVFRNQLYRPELVTHTLKKIAEALPEAPQTRSLILPPLVDWIEPKKPTIETKEPSIRIRVKIRSDSTMQDNRITTFKVLVNGRTQATAEKLRLKRDTEFYKEFEYDVPLTKGKNEITIFAATQHAGAPSDKLAVLCQVEGADWLKSNLYLVSVGISDYPLNDLKLNYADDDARSIAQLFRAQAGKLYREVFIKALYDRDATQQNIIAALEWLEEHTKQDDVAVVFIAAHGFRSGKRNFYYILPVDGNPENLRATGVNWGILAEILGNLPAPVLLLLDTCHSGQLGQDLSSMTVQRDNTEAIRELSSDEYGVVILAASTGRETSQESVEWGHGAFTATLLEALEQGLADYPPKPDGIIHLRELDLYVDYRVRELTNDSQHPTTQKPSTISRFPIVQIK